MFRSRVWTTGLQAAAQVAYQLSDLLITYWLKNDTLGLARPTEPNLWGDQPKIVSPTHAQEALLALRAALHAGGFGSAFSMAPELCSAYQQLSKIALEQLPAVIHISTAKQPETPQIGDLSELMALRNAGWGLLMGGTVQEAHDLALIAHAAALYSRIPFLHAVEAQVGAASHALIEALNEAEIHCLIDDWALLSQRQTAITPERPEARVLAHNSKLGFESLQANRANYQQCAAIVAELLTRFEAATGRAYGLCDYVGASDAERVLVAIGSAAQTARPVIAALQAKGEKVGLITLRLLRPFPQEAFLASLPTSVKALAVLDSSYEPGALGPALFSDIGMCLLEAQQNGTWQHKLPKLSSGVYGLYGKPLSQALVGALFSELEQAQPKQHITLGIDDDLLGSSLRPSPWQPQPDPARHAALWYGLGQAALLEGIANAQSALGEADCQFQAHQLDNTAGYGLQWAAKGVPLPASVQAAELLICHKLEALEQHISKLVQGGKLLLNSGYVGKQIIGRLSPQVVEQIWLKQQELILIDAERIAEQTGQALEQVLWQAFLALSGIASDDQLLNKALIAIDRRQLLALQNDARPQPSHNNQDELFGPLLKGWPIPISAVPNDGRYPAGSAAYLPNNPSRNIAFWNGQNCNQCGICSAICPQGALQAKLVPNSLLSDLPSQIRSLLARFEGMDDYEYLLQVQAELCNGCGLCVEICPDSSLALRLQDDYSSEEQLKWSAFQNMPDYQPEQASQSSLKQLQFQPSFLKGPSDRASFALQAYLQLLAKVCGEQVILVYDPDLLGLEAPFSPWQPNARGRGPSWLACHWSETVELGHYLSQSLQTQAARARALLDTSQLLDPAKAAGVLELSQTYPSSAEALREALAQLKRDLATQIAHEPDQSTEAVQLLAQVDQLLPKQVWAILAAEKLQEADWQNLQRLIEAGSQLKLLLVCPESRLLERATSRLGETSYQAQIALAASPHQALHAFQTANSFAGSALVWAHSADPKQSDLSSIQQQQALHTSRAWPLKSRLPVPKAGCNCLAAPNCRCEARSNLQSSS
jgi:pyruvate-ferredoxin/flavodoxin oxidoreductase